MWPESNTYYTRGFLIHEYIQQLYFTYANIIVWILKFVEFPLVYTYWAKFAKQPPKPMRQGER